MYMIRVPKEKGLAGPLVLTEWLRLEGQHVTQSEPIAIVEGPGTRVELQAGTAGVLLKTLVEPGQVIDGDDPLCLIGEAGEGAELRTQNPESRIQNPEDGRQRGGGLPAGVVPILMPQAGQSMEEGTLVAWKVKVGDRIQVGQVIFDIETDKATMEV
jgi:pyruvate/2-oxoglutarate dehydrogenase complex dihydrolipoamide acyltransferase (E2) component